MIYLNKIYTALLDGRTPAFPWGRRVSRDALKGSYKNEVTLLADILIPKTLTDREAATVAEYLIQLWEHSSLPYKIENVDPKNTYKTSVLGELEQESGDPDVFAPEAILKKLDNNISFEGYPELKAMYIDEPYWLDKLAALTAYVVLSKLGSDTE